MTRATRVTLVLLTALFLLRAAIAACVPLAGDEAYYALWASHLSAGYYDHPPMVAVFIRTGQALFGDTAFGVRAVGLAASLVVTALVWRTADRLLNEARAGAVAAVAFNLTVFGHLGLTVATPDAPLTLFFSAALWLTAHLATTPSPSPRVWIGLGVVMGLGLLSKYAMALPAVGLAAAWLITPSLRRQLVTPWPWAAAAVALLVFAPNLLWNADHGWITWMKQGGRVVSHWTFQPQNLAEFLLSQVGLATPLLAVLMALGLTPFAAGAYRAPQGRTVLAWMVGAPMAYFMFHALRASVEGNWPGFLYPAFAVAATAAWLKRPVRRGGLAVMGRAAAPLALLILLLTTSIAVFDAPSLGARGPVVRETAGWPDFAHRLDARRRLEGGGFVLTDNYQVAAQLGRALPRVDVRQYDERRRYDFLPSRPALSGCGLLVSRAKRDEIAAAWPQARPGAPLARKRGEAVIQTYSIYDVCIARATET